MKKAKPKPKKVKKDLLENDALVQASGYKIRYHPFGAARDLFHCQDDEILLAGPAGTGKSYSALQKIHLVLSKYPGAQGFMARKTRTSMTNSCLRMFQNQVLKPPDKVKLHKQDQVFNYPNGSILAVIGLDDPDRIKSTEWDIGYIQEATECSENDMEICTTRMRSGFVPYQQVIMDCNPDKPNHWLKVRCDHPRLVHMVDGTEKYTRTTMLVSIHEDNPQYYDHIHKKWTTKGIAYMAKLDRLSGVRRDRLYKGLWVAAEGLIYGDWDPAVNVINKSDLPMGWKEWPHYWSVDFGFIHPFVWGDWIENPKTGGLYLLHEIYMTKRLVEDHAVQMMEIANGIAPRAIICDHDAEGRATLERHTGYITLPAYKSIQIGVQGVQARLKPTYSNEPVLFIIRDCLVEEDKELKDAGKPVKTEDEWGGYVWDPKNNEKANSKKDELPVDMDNHGMDQTRYIIAFIDDLGIDPQMQNSIIMYDEEVSISPY